MLNTKPNALFVNEFMPYDSKNLVNLKKKTKILFIITKTGSRIQKETWAIPWKRNLFIGLHLIVNEVCFFRNFDMKSD